MLFGAISNSWRLQLENEDLADLVKIAQEKGSQHVELRQTCLGNYESGEGDNWRPNLPKLEDLVTSFPGLTFDLAVALPCVTTKIDPAGDLFQSCLAAAKLVSKALPHLRTVDPNASIIPWESQDDIPETAFGLIELTKESAKQGVILSIENSGQPIHSMHILVDAIRERLTAEEGMYLGLCPDPTNQLRRHPDRQGICQRSHDPRVSWRRIGEIDKC